MYMLPIANLIMFWAGDLATISGTMRADETGVVAGSGLGELSRANLQTAIDEGVAAIRSSASLRGQDPREAIQAYLADTNTQVVNSFLTSGEARLAKDYLEEDDVKDSFDSKQLTKINSTVSSAIHAVEIRDVASKLWADTVSEENTEGDINKALADLTALGLSPEDQDEAASQMFKDSKFITDTNDAADAPRLGQLEIDLLDRGIFQTNGNPLYEQLNVRGKRKWLRTLRNERRARARDGTDARRVQLEENRLALEEFRALDITGDTGNDQISIDVDNDPLFQNADLKTKRNLVSRQKGEQRKGGLNFTEYKVLVQDALSQTKLSKTQRREIERRMNGAWVDFTDDPANKGVNPGSKQIKQFFSDLLTRVDIPFRVDPLRINITKNLAIPKPLRAGHVRVRRENGAIGQMPAENLERLLAQEPGAVVIER